MFQSYRITILEVYKFSLEFCQTWAANRQIYFVTGKKYSRYLNKILSIKFRMVEKFNFLGLGFILLQKYRIALKEIAEAW